MAATGAPADSGKRKCHMCRGEVTLSPHEPAPHPSKRLFCERCEEIRRAPACLYCGEPVRGAKSKDPEPYHAECRRCASCYQLCTKNDSQMLAGRLLCKYCSHLFGRFFVPDRRSDADRMKEAFQVWDDDGSGNIEASELKRVLKALDPDFADRDVNKLIRSIDKNNNGLIDFEEFCEWIMKGDPLAVEEDGFEQFVAGLMRACGKANNDFDLDIGEVQLRAEGLFFITRGSEIRLEAASIRSEVLGLTTLDPEEFIIKVEATEGGLCLTMNTGRVAALGGHGQCFGPYQADEGFHIIGMRTKPDGDSGERVVGVDICPLGAAKTYNAPAALRFAAERELLQTLREILAKASVSVNSLVSGGATALMAAAQHGNVGALRLLLGAHADPNICDEDGWTALTFASRNGHNGAVSVLLDRGASQEGDDGSALSQALMHKHNSAARALLRAGFGPAPRGTFSLEDVPEPARCKLSRPMLQPVSGNYTQTVSVKISHEGEKDGVRLFFSLDGRDPFHSGKRYRGSLSLNHEYNHVRVVAVKGKKRSMEIDAMYRVCHYAMPDETVSGTLRVRAFPEAQQMVRGAFARVACVPAARLRTQVLTGSVVPGGKCWLRAPVQDPVPAHRLRIDKSSSIVKGEAKKKAFQEKFSKDIQKVTGSLPESVKILEGSIVVDFTLQREPAAELLRQLADPASFLRTRAKLKSSFNEAEYESTECVGDRISDTGLHNRLHSDLGKRAVVDEVVGIGERDRGTIALCCPEDQVKKLKKPFAKATMDALVDFGAIVDTPQVSSECFNLEYTMDVVAGHSVSAGKVDGGTVVRSLAAPEFLRDMIVELGHMGLSNPEVTVAVKATSRELNQLEIHLAWEFVALKKTDPPEVIDGLCMIYKEDDLVQVIDFRAESASHEAPTSARMTKLEQSRRTINRAVQHNSDIMSATGGQHHMMLDLGALPLDVTDLYFVAAAADGGDLSGFQNPTIEILDANSKRLLTSYSLSSAGKCEATIMCSLSRKDSDKWIVRALGIPTHGSITDHAPIQQSIIAMQVVHCHWERRQDLVKLKVLHKLSRMSKCSSGELARFLQAVLELPVAAFQLVVLLL